MELRPGYKKTEVGMIPSDWIVDELGHHVSINSGESPSRFKFKSEGLPYFKVDQLNNGEKYQVETPYFFESGKTVPRGSLIFPKRGASILLNKIRILTENSFMDTNLMTLTSTENLDSEYLYYALLHIQLWRVADTTSIPQINNKHIKPLVIPIPPLPEQRAIAAALSDVDALISGLDQLIAKKRDIKQATMQQLLTGQTRLPGFSEEWEVKPLKDIVDFANGKPHEGNIGPDGQYHLITLDSIDISGKLKAEHRPIKIWDNSLMKDDIVTILSDIAHGNLLGLSDVIPEDNRYVLNQRVGRLRVKPDVKASSQFLRLQINRHQSHFKNRGQGTSQRHVYRRDFDQLMIEMPMFPEQTAIAAVLSDMDAELSALEARRDKTSALKQGMMQELLTGRTRLV